MGWALADIDTADTQRQVASFAESVMVASDDVHYRHNVDWALNEQGSKDAVKIYLLETECSRGMAVILKRERPINFRIGELTLFSKHLVRYDLWRYPIINVLNGEHCDRSHQVENFFDCLSRDVCENGAIGIEGIPLNGPFWAFLQSSTKIKKDYLLLQMSPSFKHQFIKMSMGYEQYWAAFGKSSRGTLNHCRNKLNRKFKVSLRSFEKTSELDAFLDDAIKVSRKTYQWNLLGLGLRDRNDFYRRLHFAAGHDWFRSYILYCDETPVSFMLGYQYSGTYYGLEIGYDNDWRKWSVGSILKMEVLKDLFSRDDCPQLFDCSTGWSEHKARFSNCEEKEVNVLLLPRTLKNRVLYSGYISLEYCSSVLIECLNRLGVKKQVKKAFRLFSVKRGASEEKQ